MKAKVVTWMLASLMVLNSALPAYAAEKTYNDGTYQGTATVQPDSYGDFTEYPITLNVTISGGKISDISLDSNTTITRRNQSYFTDALNGVSSQIKTKNDTEGVDAVSEATCASKAIVEAVNNALITAGEKQEETKADKTALNEAIKKAEALTESDYTADSWAALQTALNSAKNLADDATQDAVDAAAKNVNNAIDALVKAETPAAEDTYVLMNIPYNVFYGLVGAGDVDVTSGATAKVRNSGVAGATYNGGGNATNTTDVTDVTKGVQFAVKVSDASLLSDTKYTEVTDDTSYDIAYSGRGKTTNTKVEGKAALIQAGDYAYYKLSEVPSNYIELTADGFSGIKGETTSVDGSATEITYGSHWGSYQINLDGISGNVAAVKVVTDKLTFGLKPTDHIWRSMEIAWSPEGVLKETNGATLQSLTVYTDQGVYDIAINKELKNLSTSEVSAGLAGDVGQVNGLPSEIENPVVTVSYTTGTGRQAVKTDVVKDVKAVGGIFDIPADAALENGKEYTVTVSSDNYIDITATATYNQEASQYVLMNIPYAEFNKLIGAGDVDVTSSATAKVRNSGVAGATYNGGGNATNTTDVTDVTKGVQFAVKVDDASILNDVKYTKVTNATAYNIAYSGRGRTTNATLYGKDALIQAPDYAYVTLAAEPANYVELTKDGFSEVKGKDVVSNDDTKSSVEYGSHWGTYLFELNGISGKAAAVKVTTDKGTFALKPTDHIWRSMEIAWSPEGVLEATNGATVENITVYTEDGVYDLNVNQKLKTLSENEISATLKSSEGTVTGLPEDIENPTAKISYTEGTGRQAKTTVVAENVKVENGKFTIPSLENGKEYTVTVSSDNYVDLSAKASYEGSSYIIIDTGDNTVEKFTDVKSDAFYYDALKWAVEKGVTAGTTATTFSPDMPTTRGQMVAFLYRMAGSPEVSGTVPFTDVKDTAFYHDAVVWAYQNGITAGTTATTFSPDEECLRGQMAQFLYKYASYKKIGSEASGETPFTDVSESAYYNAAVKWAYANKVTSGTSETTYGPDENCTRGQMVQFLYQLDQLQ